MKRTAKRSKKPKTKMLPRILKLIFLTVIFLFSTLILTYFFVFPSLFKPEDSSKNILFVSNNLDGGMDSIFIIHLSPNEDENTIFVLDGNQRVEVAGAYGEYELRSIYNLLEIDKKDSQFIKSIFSKILKLTIDEVVTTQHSPNSVESKHLKNLFLKEAYSKMKKFDGSFTVPLRLHYLANTFSLESYDSIESLGKNLYKLSTLDTDVYKHCSVAVLNTTSENDLAKDLSELIENTGAMVVRTDGTDEELSRTTVYYSDEVVDCSRLVDSISGVFSMDPEVKHIDELENNDQFRARVIIKIGEDRVE